MLAAALLAQGVLALVHNHGIDLHDAASSAEHSDGHCGHGHGQSHSDPHADNCSVCAILIARQQQLLSDSPLLLTTLQGAWIAPRAHTPQVLILADAAPSLIPRGPPCA
ncbi:MAG: hypothetical protein HUU22_04405 [Phycisphaerae bacterium]|nr:hypothetical protein [Phycisphaerae bacterium]NUQ45258.1 hypothetical protein [Phycisphaerae bacterium]